MELLSKYFSRQQRAGDLLPEELEEALLGNAHGARGLHVPQGARLPSRQFKITNMKKYTDAQNLS